MLATFQEPCVKSAERGNYKISEIRQEGHEVGLGQEESSRTQEEDESVWTLDHQDMQHGRTTEMFFATGGRKCMQSKLN